MEAQQSIALCYWYMEVAGNGSGGRQPAQGGLLADQVLVEINVLNNGEGEGEDGGIPITFSPPPSLSPFLHTTPLLFSPSPVPIAVDGLHFEQHRVTLDQRLLLLRSFVALFRQAQCHRNIQGMGSCRARALV